MNYFDNEQAALDYVMPELIATLQDDLDGMESDEAQHYEDTDREDMRNKIADLKAISDRVTLAPAVDASGA
jgi:hypothetical protein